MVYQKVCIFKYHCRCILLVFAILSKQKIHNYKKIVLQKKMYIWFSKSFFPKGTSRKKMRGGGLSYIRVTTVVKVLVVLLCVCVFRSIFIFNIYLFLCLMKAMK